MYSILILFLSSLVCFLSFAAPANSDLQIQVFKVITSVQAAKLKPTKDSCKIGNISNFLLLGAKTDILDKRENNYLLECRNESNQHQCRLSFSVKGKEGGPIADLPYSYVLSFNFNKNRNSLSAKSLECFTVP